MPKRKREKSPTEVYSDDEGNQLVLRRTLSRRTISKISSGPAHAADTADDVWRRRYEMLFEHLVVDWVIAGLPLEDQAMLLGRFRMASPAEQEWVRQTIDQHLALFIPEALES